MHCVAFTVRIGRGSIRTGAGRVARSSATGRLSGGVSGQLDLPITVRSGSVRADRNVRYTNLRGKGRQFEITVGARASED
jgi:hypothetical protein